MELPASLLQPEPPKKFSREDLNKFQREAEGTNIIFDPQSWLRQMWQYDNYDAITYNVGECFLLKKALRVVVGLYPDKKFPRVKMRYFAGIHTKLYICYKRGEPQVAYIGSQNLVKTSTINLMYTVKDPEAIQHLISYFLYFWRDGTPC